MVYIYMINVMYYMTGDSVYLEEETHREEFVLNETGRIWMGTVGKFCVRPWNFAQVTVQSACTVESLYFAAA